MAESDGFNNKLSIREARLSFQRCEMANKSFEGFLLELERILDLCKFSDQQKEERLIDQIILGVSDECLRQKLLLYDDISLSDLLTQCRSFYAANQTTSEEAACNTEPSSTEEKITVEDVAATTSNSHNEEMTELEVKTDLHEPPLPNVIICNSVPPSTENIPVLKDSDKVESKDSHLPTETFLNTDVTIDAVEENSISQDKEQISVICVENTENGSNNDEKSMEVEVCGSVEAEESTVSCETIVVSSKSSGRNTRGRFLRVKVSRLDTEKLNNVKEKSSYSDNESSSDSHEAGSNVANKQDKLLSACSKALDNANKAMIGNDDNSSQTVTVGTRVSSEDDSEGSWNMNLQKLRRQQKREKLKKEKKEVTTRSGRSVRKVRHHDSDSSDDEKRRSDCNDATDAAADEEDTSSSSSASEEEKVNSETDSDLPITSSSVLSKVPTVTRRSKRIDKKKSIKKTPPKKGTKRNREIDNLNVSDSISESDLESENVSLKRKKRRVVLKEDSDIETIDVSSSLTSDAKKASNKTAKSKQKEDEDERKNAEEKVGSEDDETTPNSKRKYIKKILSTKELAKDTKLANLEERDRRKRVSEKSKDGLVDFFSTEEKGGNIKITYTRLCFEKDKKGKDVVCMNEDLVCHLKPHQLEGVQFLWDCTVESVERSKNSKGSGAILAHCMGLGKTLQVVSFLHTMLTNEELPFTTALIIVPANTILNWVNEFEIWMPEDEDIMVYELSQTKDDKTRVKILENWHKNGGVMIMGYQMFRIVVNPKRRSAKRLFPKFKTALLDPGPDFVVCDEGHLLKNESTALSKAISQISTLRRIVLTGTPLQNNLIEYHCMVNFVKQNLLGTKNEFRNRFVNPITNGQQKDARAIDVKIMKRRSHVLHELLAGCVQRRDYSYITKYLPPKKEYVLSIRLTERQIRLYNKYLRLFCFESSSSNSGSSESSSADPLIIPKEDQILKRDGSRILFKDYQMLARIWTHPYCLKLIPPKDALSDDSEDDFICNDESDDSGAGVGSKKNGGGKKNKDGPSTSTSTKANNASSGSSSDSSDDSDEFKNTTNVNGEIIKKYKTRTGRGNEDASLREMSPPMEETFWFSEELEEEDQYNITLSGKLVLLCDILKCCEKIGDKVLLFSQSLMSLTLIEDTLAMISEAKKKNRTLGEMDSETGYKCTVDGSEAGDGDWVPNKDYLRLDGACSVSSRKKLCDQFNSKSNRRCRLFLISTRAGSLGVNLVGANRVIIFDASWNPSHDVQSMFRCYRFGQKKPVFIYRFIAQGTMEEKIYNRQVTKESLSLRVVDENQIDRHFGGDELNDLYQFEPNLLKPNEDSTPICVIPKDTLLADLLISRKDILYKYHEHDSLLQHQEDQNLTEEDKKSAWEEYEREKQGGVPLLAQMRQQQMQEEMQQRAMSAANQNFLLQQYQKQQQIQIDIKNFEKAVTSMIQWGASIGIPGSTQERVTATISQFIESIKRFNPVITYKHLTDRIYEMFPNFYLSSLGILNAEFVSTSNSTNVAPAQSQPASNQPSLGFGASSVSPDVSNSEVINSSNGPSASKSFPNSNTVNGNVGSKQPGDSKDAPSVNLVSSSTSSIQELQTRGSGKHATTTSGNLQSLSATSSSVSEDETLQSSDAAFTSSLPTTGGTTTS